MKQRVEYDAKERLVKEKPAPKQKVAGGVVGRQQRVGGWRRAVNLAMQHEPGDERSPTLII
jgi:hypothetical protein